MSSLKILGSAVLVGLMLATPATAGGLFGKGGLIRGDVGNFIDKHVEQPVLTPLARGTVEAGGAVIGGAVGGYVGGPTGGAIGGMVGRGFGQEINRCFAGQCAPGQPASPPVHAAPGAYPTPRFAPIPQFGNRCATPVGVYFGPANPVGMPCTAMTPWGYHGGRVVL